MHLRYINLSPDYEYEKSEHEFRVRFLSNVQFINSYFDGLVKKLNIVTSTYTMLAIILHPSREGCEEWKCAKSLSVYIRYNKEDIAYLNTLTDLFERFEYYLSLYEKGYRIAIASGYNEIPLDALLQIHEQFRKEGYENKWLWKKKMLREDDIYIFFNVRYSSFDLKMNMIVMDRKKSVVKCVGTVFQMTPFYDYFWSSFRKLLVADDEIVILDFLDHPFMTIDRQKLRNGEICTTLLNEAAIDSIESWQKEIKDITW